MITESRVGKASRLTSSAGGGPESKPRRLTYFGILTGTLELGEFIVMPNHVHAIVAAIGGHQFIN